MRGHGSMTEGARCGFKSFAISSSSALIYRQSSSVRAEKKGEGMLPFSAPVMPVSWFMWLWDADLENIWAEKANGSLLCVPQPSVCLMTAGFGYSLLWFRAHSPMWLKWTSWAKTQFSGDCRVSASGKTFLFMWHLTFSDSLSRLRESELLIWVFEEQILNQRLVINHLMIIKVCMSLMVCFPPKVPTHVR